MTLIIKGIKELVHPRIFLKKSYDVLLENLAPLIPDKLFIKLKWRQLMNYSLNLDNPKTFNEKLQWLKLHDRRPEYTQMVDKCEAKKYVAAIIGEEHIIPTIAVYESVEDIDFNALPNKFVLKCTHDSGGVVVCRDKKVLDMESAKQKLQQGLKQKFYWQTREWPYKNVKPRIIAEQYMEDESGYELRDYKFFVFNGRCEYFKIDFDRSTNHHANYYNRDCSLAYFGELHYPPIYETNLSIPSNITRMIELSEKLAAQIKSSFVRIDFYNVKNSIFFGEITFFPASGVGQFTSDEWDMKLGQLIKLDNEVN